MPALMIPSIIQPEVSDFCIYSLEGIDGSGKTTQAKSVVKSLNARGINVVYATNPSKTKLGKFLRENLSSVTPWQRVSLFILDIWQLITELDSKSIIIWDRYLDSTLISNKEYDPEKILPLIEGFPPPRKTFFLDIAPHDILKFHQNSAHDHSNDLDWQNLKYMRYKKLIKKNREDFIVIDGNLEQKEITSQIVEYILKDLDVKNINRRVLSNK